MKYALLISIPPEKDIQRGHPQYDEMMAEYTPLLDELRASGAFAGTERLQGVETAATVRVREGAAIVSDGPFAETREQLGGFILIDVASHEEAIEIAKRVPGATRGCVEVRPILEWQ